MRITTSSLAILLIFASAASAQPMTAEQLSSAVMTANGCEQWGKIKTIRWTFAGKNKHVWNVKAGTDTITIGDKTATIHVDKMPTDPEEKKLFARWTNDSYWLIAPLKCKDAGVMVSAKPDETYEGKTYHVLHLAFQGVGMTPGDQYNWLIDPTTNLLAWWDYMPTPEKKTRMSWEGYKDFNGLKIATEHKFVGSDRVLKMEDVSVEFE